MIPQERDAFSVGYRPIPSDFREVFARVGWQDIRATYRAHSSTIRGWIAALDAEAEANGEPLCAELRRTAIEAQYAARGRQPSGRKPGFVRARRYVAGRTLTPRKSPDQP